MNNWNEGNKTEYIPRKLLTAYVSSEARIRLASPLGWIDVCPEAEIKKREKSK